ncbi:MAG: prepilin-type N-terminal cleavage/methylation domain-containing protein [Desulfobacterales bacterium]|nr:prepilin-type N-terminal cleavage/methylation domain-containing protein [Desulfobacterales bacterium]MBI5896090.1 prepilin-type N-terminal cleavage/methylation domain-containing protein [Desulfobacterales bacterium]
MQKQNGFTLIELMVVISIIGILAAIAIPQFSAYRDRAYRAEGHSLGGALREEISVYYDTIGMLPENNKQLALPAPETIRGKYVSAISIEKGDVAIRFSDTINSAVGGKVLRLKVAINPDNPTGPLLWEWINPNDKP